ncbi:MAG TPA: GGDEF domain-containing protein [Acidimicrobiales bacterium]
MAHEVLAARSRTHAAEIVEKWSELCRSVPPARDSNGDADTRPAIAEEVVAAVVSVLEGPQSPGWELDPPVDDVMVRFATETRSSERASAQLVCLRDAFDQVVIQQLPAPERLEGMRQVAAITQRAVYAVSRSEIIRLRAAVLTDPLTGMLNRRAFDEDLARASAHFDRVGTPFSVAMIDLIGLKTINDTEGHVAGDAALRAMAAAIQASTRADDRGYRLGGDEFALILGNTMLAGASELQQRLRDAGAPPCSIGIASLPEDPRDDLVAVADRRLYAGRRAHSH